MSNFSKAKKYYTNAEVEKRSKELLGKLELKVSEQNTQLAGLQVQVEKQKREIKELKKREKLIRTALIYATDQAKAAYDEAKAKRTHAILRLDELRAKYYTKLDAQDSQLAKRYQAEMAEIISDLKSGAGAAELARRRELEKAREKVNEANAKIKESQKELDARYRMVLDKYNQLKTDENEFSIEEALNPTASLEDIMKEIFKK